MGIGSVQFTLQVPNGFTILTCTLFHGLELITLLLQCLLCLLQGPLSVVELSSQLSHGVLESLDSLSELVALSCRNRHCCILLRCCLPLGVKARFQFSDVRARSIHLHSVLMGHARVVVLPLEHVCFQ